MAVTKIKAIRGTLSKAIAYILNPEKTDEKLLVSSYGCASETAAREFEWTRKIALAVDKSDPLLNISDERDALRHGLPPVSARRPSGNPLLDAFLGVVLSDGLRTSKPLLSFSAKGDIFAGLDFITGFLHEPQKIIVILRCDDESVNGLLEFLLPARAALGFGVLLVAHAFVLRGRDNRETVFLTEPVADLTHIIVNPLVALVCVVVHKVNRIENQMVVNMVFVNVSGQHILIFSSEDFICKLLANLVGKLRCDLSDFKGLDHMTVFDYCITGFIPFCSAIFRVHSNSRAAVSLAQP